MNPTPWLLPEAAEVAKLHSMLLVELKAPPKEGCVESALGAAVSAGVYAVEDPADTDLICLSAHALLSGQKPVFYGRKQARRVGRACAHT